MLKRKSAGRRGTRSAAPWQRGQVLARVRGAIAAVCGGGDHNLWRWGHEGLVGISLFMGGETTPSRAIVQSTGHAYRLKGRLLKDEFGCFGGRRAGVLHDLLLHYTQALLTQMAQTAVCNRHHTLDQQFCRWLLLSFDRLPSNERVMTQELIANMLGVRREAVTEAAVNVQRAGLIQYHRGRITLLDRPELEARACECYAVVKQEFDRLLPHPNHP